ncbi:MAG TPA: gas vesicle protein GvpN [Methylococcus sp.]|nr:gas vesicle protein GvpN [Methylococcus sp.]
MNTPTEENPGLMVAEDVVQVSADSENILLEASEQFVNTPYVQELTERALTYLSVGYAVHLAGPAGTGKTTLALHVAAQLGRPIMLLHGDDEFTSGDLVGRGSGYRKSRVVDNFIHSVLKTEEQMTTFWVDNRLTTACERGYTLIYDEFNRSKAEANNTLLSVLAEGILNLPNRRHHGGSGFIEVHPKFRAIFTSNPDEYVGVHKTPDALMDRMITIDVGHHDRETEIQITRAKSGIALTDAETIVDLVRRLRGEKGHRPTIRACIAIARVLVHRQARAQPDDPVFDWVCRDVLGIDSRPGVRPILADLGENGSLGDWVARSELGQGVAAGRDGGVAAGDKAAVKTARRAARKIEPHV